MSNINRQKFLVELEKLLTFMYEEDRETAIAMYNKMFELAPDEDALMSFLVSPTRQAVQIARSYDANERRLSTEAVHGYNDAQIAGAEPAPFIETIREIFSEALDAFPDKEPERTEEKRPVAPTPNWMDEKLPEAPIPDWMDEKLPAAPTPDWMDEKLPAAPIPERQNSYVMEPDITNTIRLQVERQVAESLRLAQMQQAASAQQGIHQTDLPPQTGGTVLRGFERSDLPQSWQEPATSTPPESSEPEKEIAEEPVEQQTTQEDGKLSGGALVLFLLIAIPLTALGLILIFALAIAFFAVAACGFIMGYRIVEAGFGSFAVFADVLVVTGTGFIVLALALLAFWTGIWLLIGVTSKLVNGIINLAIRICTKGEKNDG